MLVPLVMLSIQDRNESTLEWQASSVLVSIQNKDTSTVSKNNHSGLKCKHI